MVMGDMEISCDLLVIGGTTAADSAALLAAEGGLDVILVEDAAAPDTLPQKDIDHTIMSFYHLSALFTKAKLGQEIGLITGPPVLDLKKSQDWVEKTRVKAAEKLHNRFKKLGVLSIRGKSRFESSTIVKLEGSDYSRVRFKHVILAGNILQTESDGKMLKESRHIVSPSTALKLQSLPEKVLIIGAKSRALELSTLASGFGSRVTLVAEEPRLLPEADIDLVEHLLKKNSHQFENIYLSALQIELIEAGDSVHCSFIAKGETISCFFDLAIVAVDNIPSTLDLSLENTEVSLNENGLLLTNDRMQTSDPHIFGIGEICSGRHLTAKAIREAEIAVENICGKSSFFDARAIPVIVYTNPQICWCGHTEQLTHTSKTEIVVKKYFWQDTDIIAVYEEETGFTKLLVEPKSGRILGGGIVGNYGESLLGEICLAIEMGALAEDLALTLHPHRSLSQTISKASSGQSDTR